MDEFFLRGDQIGTYGSLWSTGKSEGIKIELDGVSPLGTSAQTFRVVIRQNAADSGTLLNGQMIEIYAWPGAEGDAPLFSGLDPQHDQFEGLAASPGHQIFTEGQVVIDLDGITGDSIRYGPGGKSVPEGEFSYSDLTTIPGVVCFAAGTVISTPLGDRPIETLRVGDIVMTADHGPQPLRWIGSVTVPGRGRFAPIAFAPGAIGNARILRVSPQHRMLLRDWRAELWFGAPESLVAAKHLVNDSGIRPAPCDYVTYLHMMFDAHEIVFAEGVPSESLHLGSVALTALDAQARAEIIELFPDALSGANVPQTARPSLKAWEGRLLAQAMAG